MAKIKKLGAAIVNQIAAGEVVIQPCSVLKELVENSIDAGATRIEVSFRGSGADELKVMDNGMGMAPDDLEVCIEAHATSKIQEAQDLYRVVSCGFRGEALASIAEVSHLEITSKCSEHESAHQLKRDGEGKYRISRSSRSQGTTIAMKGLFHNVPVRRRFLKSERAETANNLEQLRKLALARPHVAFDVNYGDNKGFSLDQDQDLESRVRDLGLFDNKAEFLSFDEEQGSFRVHGLSVAPPLHFGNGQKIHLYVNRRPFKDKALQQALLRAYTSYIPERRFPGAVVFIDMDPEEVDVNIHPTKSEVRFREPELIFKLVYASLRQPLLDSAQVRDESDEGQVAVYKTSGLAKTVPMNRNYGGVYDHKPAPFNPVPRERQGGFGESSSAFESPTPISKRSEQDGGESWSLAPRFPTGDQSSGLHGEPDGPLAIEAEGEVCSQEAQSECSALFDMAKAPKSYQLLKRFILLEYDDHIEMMDQHAIHERVLVNQLSHGDRGQRYTSQTLLVPAKIAMPEALADFGTAMVEDLEDMGFRVELDDKNQMVEVKGLPDFLKLERGLCVLEEILEDLVAGVPPDRDALRRDILNRTACRAAIKAGDVLSRDELDGLVAAVLTMDANQKTCPHGRSTTWRISIDEANRMFDRP